MRATLLTLALLSGLVAEGRHIHWPTNDDTFFQGAEEKALIQPASSGKLETGLFGCWRNHRTSFHEGIDIKAKKKDKRGEALDDIVAVLPGRVVHMNKIGGNSSYGKYVVLEHQGLKPEIYTLYAHMADFDKKISIGSVVKEGSRLGKMGRTANHKIPKSQAHLHFEVGLKLTDNFQKWYNEKRFGSKNRHNTWSGLNLVGIDPWAFFVAIREDHADDLAEYVKDLPTAFILRVMNSKLPDFLKRYPSLIEGQLTGPIGGWDIEFTWYGLPKKWKPIGPKVTGKSMMQFRVPGVSNEIHILGISKKELTWKKPVKIVYLNNKGGIEIGSRLKDTLKLLFKY